MRKSLSILALLAALIGVAPTALAADVNPSYGSSLHVTLQNAAVATSNGTAMDVGRLGSVGVAVIGITTATVTFEANADESTFKAIQCANLGTGAVASETTADGNFVCPIGGMQQFRARISAYTSGTITASANGLQFAVPAVVAPRTADFRLTHTPAANTQATIGPTAGVAGIKHCATSVSVDLLAGATAPAAATATASLRDGATGAGTVLQSWALGVQATAGSGQHVTETFSTPICGSAATAMTLEFGAAAGANTLEAVSISGFDIS